MITGMGPYRCLYFIHHDSRAAWVVFLSFVISFFDNLDFYLMSTSR